MGQNNEAEYQRSYNGSDYRQKYSSFRQERQSNYEKEYQEGQFNCNDSNLLDEDENSTNEKKDNN